MSAFVAAFRQVAEGTHATGSWQLEHPIPAMFIWCAVIIAICVPIGLRRFKNAD